MNYAVKITDNDGKEICFGDNEYTEDSEVGKGGISSVEIFLDSVNDNAKDKDDAMIARIIIKGEISSNITKQLIDIFNWSLDFKASSVNRKVEIKIIDKETPIRKYIFKNMFVVDYKEAYDAVVVDDTSKSYFELKLNQVQNCLKTIDTH